MIYIDNDFKCHVTNDGTRRPFEVSFFDGKCDAFIEGYRYIPVGETWKNEDEYIFVGEMVAPWKDYSELDSIQREYDRERLADAENALSILYGGVV